MVEQTDPKAQIKADLTALATKHIDAYDTYPVKYSGKNYDFESRQTNDPDLGGAIVTVCKAKVPGLTIEKVKDFIANPD